MDKRDVFISYSSKDDAAAHSIRNVLLKNGISCWIAPDDIPFSMDYIKSIPSAIEQSEIFLFLITKNSQASKWVRIEVQRALNKGKPVIPFLMENCPIDEAFDFAKSDSFRINAFKQKDAALEQLVRRINALLGRADTPANRDGFSEYKRASRGGRLVGAVIAAAAAAVLLCAGVLAFVLTRPSPTPDTPAAHDEDSGGTAETSAAESGTNAPDIALDDSDYTGECGGPIWKLDPADLTLYISGDGDMDDYESSAETPWKRYRNLISRIVINPGVTSIGSNAFSNMSKLSSADIPSSVNSIGDWAFKSSSLESVELPEGLTEIGNSAFISCKNLRQITIPSTVSQLGAGAFNQSGLEAVEIRADLHELPDSVFAHCVDLTSISLPDDLKKIGDHAFASCESLESITIPDSVTYIDEWAFSFCYKLQRIEIPGNVSFIGQWAFVDCIAATEVDLRFDMEYLPENCFSGCSSLRSVSIPSGVKTIGSGCFYDCSSLSSVILPDTLTEIGEKAFLSCSSLKSLTIPASVGYMGGLSVGYHRYAKSNNTDVHDELYTDFVLYTGGNSAAIDYAKKNGVNYR